jgi:hypothetical protein
MQPETKSVATFLAIIHGKLRRFNLSEFETTKAHEREDSSATAAARLRREALNVCSLMNRSLHVSKISGHQTRSIPVRSSLTLTGFSIQL